jgi:predicted nucleotidyltransferase component of viral defense system
MTQPIGLQADDLADTMARFGVAAQQVRRDHVISHILAALSRDHRDELIFFGGTALSRTHLRDERLSEDIDLIATGRRDDLAAALIDELGRALARTHGRITWAPAWSSNSEVEPATAVTPDGIAIKIQLLSADRYEPWPTEFREIEQRYRDAPPAVLRVPTLESFAGWKTVAWLDRRAPRDLYDLWALTTVGALNEQSAALFARHGPTGKAPRSWMFDRPPSTAEWQAQLAGQTRLTVTAAEALRAVRDAWASATDARPTGTSRPGIGESADD